MQDRLAGLEHDLLNVQGVQSARVIGDDEPAEIHIVASLQRSPKQVVRDVQSLAAARFGMPIDHRIVSVVQLDEEPEQPERQAVRPILERVVMASRGQSSWVKVGLGWPDGRSTEGAGMSISKDASPAATNCAIRSWPMRFIMFCFANSLIYFRPFSLPISCRTPPNQSTLVGSIIIFPCHIG